jgi:hypothetical protein
MRLKGHVARTGEKRNVYRLLVESQKERALGRSRISLVDNNKINLVEI